MITDEQLKEANKKPTLQELAQHIRLTLYCKNCDCAEMKCYLANFGVIIACNKCNSVECSLTPDMLKYMVDNLSRNKDGVQ